MATRLPRQPAYEAARLVLQHSHSGCRGEYLPVSGQLTSQVVVLHETEWLGEDVCCLFLTGAVADIKIRGFESFEDPGKIGFVSSIEITECRILTRF